MTAEQHYTLALEDSDVCIFLIDNADGVPEGVQKEVDTVKRTGGIVSGPVPLPTEKKFTGSKFCKK